MKARKSFDEVEREKRNKEVKVENYKVFRASLTSAEIIQIR